MNEGEEVYEEIYEEITPFKEFEKVKSRQPKRPEELKQTSNSDDDDEVSDSDLLFCKDGSIRLSSDSRPKDVLGLLFVSGRISKKEYVQKLKTLSFDPTASRRHIQPLKSYIQ